MDIKKLRELCEKATPGPWEWQYSEKWGTSVFNDTLGVITAYTNERGNPDITIAEEDLEFIAAARTALPEILDEVERLRKEVRLLNERINVIKWSIVEAVGGVSYDGQTTNTLNCLQRLRILVEKEEALGLACFQLADVMGVCPDDLERAILEKVRGE